MVKWGINILELDMGKFDGVLICTDLDGTLFRDDKTVSKENLDAIEYFKSEGGYFTFVTGRPPCLIGAVYDLVKPNAPIGCVNGGAVYDYENQKYLWLKPLPSDVMELVDYIDVNVEGVGIQPNGRDKLYIRQENPAMEVFRQITDKIEVVSGDGGFDDDLIKIVFADYDEGRLMRVAELLDKHPRADEFEFLRTEKILYEISPKGINKGAVLPRLSEILGVLPEKIIAVGDYYNDLEMIRTAGVGVAVANAVDEVKAVADYITVSNEEHAIARVIEELDRGILKL